MPRPTSFINNQIYHIYNRGVRKSKLFLIKPDHIRWEKLLYWSFTYDYSYSKYLFRIQQAKQHGITSQEILAELDLTKRFRNPSVEILTYNAMPNHYHLMLRQLTDNGIIKFMHKLQTSYSKYINILHGFKGAVYEGKFKAALVQTDEQLLQLFRYIHTNPLAAGLVTKEYLLNYPWSSLSSYVNNTDNPILSKDFMLRIFDNNTDKLWKFTIAEYDKSEIETIQDMTHDDDYGWYQERRKQKKEEYKKMIDEVRVY